MLIKIKTGIMVSGYNTFDKTRSFINSFIGEDNDYHGKSDRGYSVSTINSDGDIFVNFDETNSKLMEVFMKPNVEIISIKKAVSESVLIQVKNVNYKKDHITSNMCDFASYMKNKKNLTIEIQKIEDSKVSFKGKFLNVSNILIRVTGEKRDIDKLIYSGIGVGTGHGFGFCKFLEKSK